MKRGGGEKAYVHLHLADCKWLQQQLTLITPPRLSGDPAPQVGFAEAGLMGSTTDNLKVTVSDTGRGGV